MDKHHHETRDLNPVYILYFAVALATLLLAVYGLNWWMFHQLEGEQTVPRSESMAGPRLQINPEADLQELRRQETEILSTYRWIDREKGTARIPIDRAMQLFVERQKK